MYRKQFSLNYILSVSHSSELELFSNSTAFRELIEREFWHRTPGKEESFKKLQ